MCIACPARRAGEETSIHNARVALDTGLRQPSAAKNGPEMCRMEARDAVGRLVKLEECCATGIFFDLESNSHVLVTSLTIAACHLDLQNKNKVCVEVYSCSGSAREREEEEEDWHLCGAWKVPPKCPTQINFDEPVLVTPEGICGLHLYAGRKSNAYISCVPQDTVTAGPLTVHAGCSSRPRAGSGNPFVSSRLIRQGRLPWGSVEFVPDWARVRLLWIGVREDGCVLSKLAPILLQYILHLSRMKRDHDPSVCETCRLFGNDFTSHHYVPASPGADAKGPCRWQPMKRAYSCPAYKCQLTSRGLLKWHS